MSPFFYLLLYICMCTGVHASKCLRAHVSVCVRSSACTLEYECEYKTMCATVDMSVQVSIASTSVCDAHA